MSTKWTPSQGVRATIAAFALLFGASLLGCGNGSTYEVAPVQGTLTIGSRPMAGAKVMFAPVAKGAGAAAGKAAVGLTQSNGNFTLTTYRDGDGAVVGEHWVTIFAPQTEQPRASAPGDPAPTETSYKRLTVNEKQNVVAGQENVIDIAL
jgi:hypothetical protein